MLRPYIVSKWHFSTITANRKIMSRVSSLITETGIKIAINLFGIYTFTKLIMGNVRPPPPEPIIALIFLGGRLECLIKI